MSTIRQTIPECCSMISPEQYTALRKKWDTEKENKKYQTFAYKGLKFTNALDEMHAGMAINKICSKCGQGKPLPFYTGNTSGSDAFDRDGLRLRRPECSECTSAANRGKDNAKRVAKSQGIPYKAPEGTVCALCKCLPKKGNGMVFDHDHETELFRGYLCNSCNRSMGVLGDDVEGMIKALNYLNKTEKKKIVQEEDGSLRIVE